MSRTWNQQKVRISCKAKVTTSTYHALYKSFTLPLILQLFFAFTFFPSIPLAGGITLPRDSQGWTIFTPSSDSRIMYVSEDGDNSTAIVYTQGNHPSWNTPFNPSAVNSFATISAALAQSRQGYPDYVLLKRGDVFTVAGSFPIVPVRGRSITEPSLLGAYGTVGPLPRVETANDVIQALRVTGLIAANFIAVANIDFYSPTRDPGNILYTGTLGSSQMGMFIYNGNPGGFLIEGCKFRFFGVSTIDGTSLIEGVTLRRCTFADAYSGTGQGHCQGLFIGGQNVTLDENVFIHNGWYDVLGGPIGEATIYNHNVYNGGPYGAIYTGNIFIQGSNMNTKFTARNITNPYPIVIENNLYIDGQQGIGFGNNTVGYTAFSDVTVKDNVFTNIGKTRNIQGISWGIDLGFDVNGAEIYNNYLIHQTDPSINNGNFAFALAGVQTDINIYSNVIYGIKNGRGVVVSDVGGQNSQGSTKTNVQFNKNKFIIPINAGYTVQAQTTVNGVSFNNNTYYSDRLSSDLFRGGTTSYSLAGWQALTGDTSVFEQVTFPDPTRSIETYMTSIGETPSLETFYAKCRAQDRYNWDIRFTAAAVNAWIKGGFAVTTRPQPTRDFELVQ